MGLGGSFLRLAEGIGGALGALAGLVRQLGEAERGGLGLLAGLRLPGEGVGLVRGLVAGEQGVDVLDLGPDGGQVLFTALELAVQSPELPQRSLDKGELPLQLGQQAGLVVAAAVELTPQAVGDGGAGHVLLAGGDEGVDALLQGCVGADSQTALADEGAADVDLLGDAQQELSAVRGGEALHGGGGAGIDGGKGGHGGVGPGGAPGEGQVPATGAEVHTALHESTAPGLVAAFIGVRAAIPGVQTVEHNLKKGGPGGFPALVGGFYHVQSGPERQLRTLQTAEGGGQLLDVHGIPPQYI